MEKVEQFDSSVTSNSMTDHNSKSLTSFEADRSFTEFCDENSRLVEEIRESPSPTSPYGKNVALVQPNNHRRSDEPTELSFEKCRGSRTFGLKFYFINSFHFFSAFSS